MSSPAKLPLSEDDIRKLIAVAAKARSAAYVPYSHFAVGAALLSASGKIFTGCNVENASFGLTICAERNALAHAVAEGVRDFSAVVVVTENGVTPCGACRQVLAEFSPEMAVVVVDAAGRRHDYTLADLLPAAFSPAQLPSPPVLPSKAQ